MLLTLWMMSIRSLSFNFVPKHRPVQENDINGLKDFIFSSKKLVALTGAGVSTESGIPDYRSEKVGLYARTNHKPIQYQEFMKHPHIRQRYWARNYVGWKRFSSVLPNDTHHILQRLEAEAMLEMIVTQNVDNLHTKAGSKHVIELHGTAYKVQCLHCDYRVDRHTVQEEMKMSNSQDVSDFTSMIRPDGDVDVPVEFIQNFVRPKCRVCGNDLKPDIVFFGDNVRKETVEKVEESIRNCDSLLILGSSLQVLSSYRIFLQAFNEKKKICLINIGPTRADDKISNKIATNCGDLLSRIM